MNHPHAIVSYDDTQNDHDALALGRVLHDVGAAITLAYVRHVVHRSADDEHLSRREAEALLDRGARWFDDAGIDRRVVVSPSTSDGLRTLASETRADIVVFGSDYRTSRGHVSIGRTAQSLLENGLTALALAPAEYAQSFQAGIRNIGVLKGSADEAAIETAFSLAGRVDAQVLDSDRGVDLLVVGSRQEAREGRVMISSRATHAIEEATCPVLVVARGVPLHFETLVTA